jgi:hypothetical protein
MAPMLPEKVVEYSPRVIVKFSLGPLAFGPMERQLCVSASFRSRIRRGIERLRESGVARLFSITTPKGYA